jgi:hypothetical protein
MGTNRELAQLVSIRGGDRKNRWYGCGISECLARLETGIVPRKQALNWDKVLSLATVLAVVALGWTAVGFAVSHFLR